MTQEIALDADGLPEDPDTDFCYTCDEVTKWDGQFCSKCHREWGYDRLPGILTCGCCEHCGCGCK